MGAILCMLQHVFMSSFGNGIFIDISSVIYSTEALLNMFITRSEYLLSDSVLADAPVLPYSLG